MRIRIARAVVLAVVALTAMTGAAQAAPAVTGSQANNASLSGAFAVAISGHDAYSVAYWSGQLCVFDVSNPGVGPTPVGTCTPPSTAMTAATSITISGNYAYVTAKNRNGTNGVTTNNDDGSGNSLTVVSISNPTAPSIVASVHDTTNLFGAEGVAVSTIGGTPYAFVASQGLINGEPTMPDTSTGSFSVFNVSNPASPTFVTTIQNSSLTGTQTNALEHVTSVAISGTTAYVTAQYSNTLTAIDISNPASPTILATFTSTARLNKATGIAVSGSDAYVANQNSGGPELTIVDVSSPMSMMVVGTLTNPSLSGAYRIALSGTTAYVSANNAATVDAIDVSTPAAPTLLGSVQDTTNLRNVTGLAVDPNGQYVLAASPNASTTPPPTFPPYPTPGSANAPTGTISMIGLTAVITPSSEPANPTTSTSANFAFTSVDPAATFTCSLDGAPATACASGSQIYAGLPVGSHTFTVQTTDTFGLTAQASYTWTVKSPSIPPPPPPAPVNTVAPTLSGTPTLGNMLSVGNGTWSGATSFTYQWERCDSAGANCSPIAGQTGASYTTTVGDLGQRLMALVTGANSTGTSTAATATTAVVGWPPGSFASAGFHFSRAAGASLTVSVPGAGGTITLTKLVIGLPKGLSWAGSAAHLAKGFVVKDGTGRKLAFSLSLSHGKVTLTFTNPPTALKITVKARFVKVSGALARKLAAHKIKSLTSGISADYQGAPVRQGSLTFQVH